MNSSQGNLVKENIGTILEGVPARVCIFCGFMTSIDFDLDLHLYENHRKMLWRLPIRGSVGYRISYVTRLGKIWLNEW